MLRGLRENLDHLNSSALQCRGCCCVSLMPPTVFCTTDTKAPTTATPLTLPRLAKSIREVPDIPLDTQKFAYLST
jgi:hypothetical protein